jgi:hypothetical protein
MPIIPAITDATCVTLLNKMLAAFDMPCNATLFATTPLPKPRKSFDLLTIKAIRIRFKDSRVNEM